jgi:hypothetical protein
MKSIYLKLVCFIAGYPYAILKNYDAYSQRKIGVLAISMMFPVGIYALDGWLVSRNICHASVGEAIIASLIAAFFIFLLEKAIVMTKVTRGLSAFRIAVACGLSFIGAIGLMIDLFHQDVDHQITVELQKQSKDYAKTVAENHQKETLRLDSLQKIYQAQYKKFADLAAAEAKGTTTSKPGVGSIARYYVQQRDFTELNYLRPLRAQSDSLDRVMAAEVNAEAKKQEGNVGLMARVQALFTFAFSTALGILLFFVFFGVLIGLELMVLALKNGMRTSAYERDEDDYNHMHEQRSNQNRSLTYQYNLAH